MKKILVVLVGIVAVIAIMGMVIPQDFRVEREVVINKPKDFVFSQLKMLKNHDQWSPWAKKDPNMLKEYRGKDGTVGFVSAWSGNKEVGVGEQQIIYIAEGQKIELELRFKKPMEDTSRAYLITEAVDEQQTKVRWGMTGKSPFPGNIICALIGMQNKLGNDFETGLNNLKNVLEQ